MAITDFDFSDEFNRAIEEKVKAEQEALKAKNEKLRRVTQAEALRDNPSLIQLRIAEKWDGQLPQVNGGGAIPLLNIEAAGKATR